MSQEFDTDRFSEILESSVASAVNSPHGGGAIPTPFGLSPHGASPFGLSPAEERAFTSIINQMMEGEGW